MHGTTGPGEHFGDNGKCIWLQAEAGTRYEPDFLKIAVRNLARIGIGGLKMEVWLMTAAVREIQGRLKEAGTGWTWVEDLD